MTTPIYSKEEILKFLAYMVFFNASRWLQSNNLITKSKAPEFSNDTQAVSRSYQMYKQAITSIFAESIGVDIDVVEVGRERSTSDVLHAIRQRNSTHTSALNNAFAASFSARSSFNLGGIPFRLATSAEKDFITRCLLVNTFHLSCVNFGSTGDLARTLSDVEMYFAITEENSDRMVDFHNRVLGLHTSLTAGGPTNSTILDIDGHPTELILKNASWGEPAISSGFDNQDIDVSGCSIPGLSGSRYSSFATGSTFNGIIKNDVNRVFVEYLCKIFSGSTYDPTLMESWLSYRRTLLCNQFDSDRRPQRGRLMNFSSLTDRYAGFALFTVKINGVNFSVFFKNPHSNSHRNNQYTDLNIICEYNKAAIIRPTIQAALHPSYFESVKSSLRNYFGETNEQ